MLHHFESIDHFLFTIETELVNVLYEYELLGKMTKDVKKIIFYIFVKRLSERLEKPDLLFYHNMEFSDLHSVFDFFDKESFTKYINKICKEIKKNTNKLFFLNKKITLPQKSIISDLDGSVIDEILLLKEKSPVKPKELKEFLDKNHLKDLFKNLSKKVC